MAPRSQRCRRCSTTDSNWSASFLGPAKASSWLDGLPFPAAITRLDEGVLRPRRIENGYRMGGIDGDLSQPGGPALLVADGAPRSPGEFHGVLHRILRFLGVSQHGQRQAVEPAGIPLNASLEGCAGPKRRPAWPCS